MSLALPPKLYLSEEQSRSLERTLDTRPDNVGTVVADVVRKVAEEIACREYRFRLGGFTMTAALKLLLDRIFRWIADEDPPRLAKDEGVTMDAPVIIQ